MNWLGKILEKLIKESKKSREWRTFVFCLAAVVVFTTTYSLILPAITVETNTTDSVGGLVMEETDPESTGAGAEASDDVVTVDAESEPSETAESSVAPEENDAGAASAPTSSKGASVQTESVYEETDEQEEAEEYREPYNGEVQTYGDRRFMYLTGDEFDVTVSGDLSVDVPDGTILSVRGIPDQSVVKSYSDRISEELLKLYVDRKTTEVLYQLVFTDKDQYEYTPKGYFDIQFDFHKNTVDHSKDLIYAAIYNYLTDEMILAEKNGDVHETPVIYLDEYGAVTSIYLKGINFNEFSDIITLVAGPVNEKLKLEAEKAAAGTESERESETENKESGSDKEKSTDSKTESGSDKDKSTDSKTESGKDKTETTDSKTDSKTESGKDKTESTDSKTESGKDKTESTDSKTDSKTESGKDETGSTDSKTDSKTESGKDETGSTDSKTEFANGTLSVRGGDYTVTLAYGADAKIPGNAALEVTEIENGTIEYKKYLEQAKAAMGLDADQELPKDQARFFDIRIMVDGKEVQPAANVSVNIVYDQPVLEAESNTEAQIDANAVHFGERGAEVVEVSEADTTGVEFEAGSFSVYGVIYTVDFETIDGGTFSVPGDGSYALADILAMLGYDIGNGNIVDAFFSDPQLISITVDDGIWMLHSLAPFDTSEVLTVKTADGKVYEINVTDASVTYEGVEYGNLVDLSNSIGVTVNGTNLNNQQDRDKTLNLTFNYNMLFGNAAAAIQYKTSGHPGTYNWCYDLSEMAAEYPEIAEFPNMSGTLRNGRKTLGTYEVIDNVVYLHVYENAIERNPRQISGNFTINMALDANGTGSEDSTKFNFPGGSSITVKYKPVEYEDGDKSANPTSATVYPDQFDDGYYKVDYTAHIVEQYDLTSLTFNDVLGPGQELIASSVRVNGQSASVTTGVDSATGSQTFSLNVLDALGSAKLPANTDVDVTYTVRVPKSVIDAAKEEGHPLTLTNVADWKIGDTTVPGGDTTVTIEEKDYTNPTKTIKNESSQSGGGTVVDPNGEKKDGAVKATLAMQNADGSYHISYGIEFSEGAVPKTMSLTDTYGDHQTLLTDSFTVTYNGTKYAIPSDYITDQGGSYTITDLKGAIKAATRVDFVAGAQYSINYETSVTAADFDVEITNSAELIMDKEYPTDETTITLTSEDFQPGTKRNASSKYIKLANDTDEQTTDWEISITEPKNANKQAMLTDSFDSRLSVIADSFTLSIGGTEYSIPASLVDTTSEQNKFKVDLNAVLAYLRNNIAGYTGNPYVTAGVSYVLKFKTETDVATVAAQAKSGDQTLKNEADWVFEDDNGESPQDGGEDTVTYTIPDYTPTGKSDTVSGNVAKANGRYGDASYYITGEGPYTINYTITVPAQELDLTSATLTDVFTENQTIDWNSFKVNGQTIQGGLSYSAYSESDPGTTENTFTMDLLAAMGLTKLEAGTAVTITYTATTEVLNQKIENHSSWNFNGEYDDGPHDTVEKIVEPEYQPGSKYVYNENENNEVTINPADKYSFDWTLTITEPTELTEAVLHDDYGTDSKNHDMKFPITVTANGVTKTIESASDPAIENWDTTAKTFDIDMITLFGVEKFPANTTFVVKYSTETTGDTVIISDPDTYHNEATWDFDGTIGPNDEPVPGGEDETTLKTTEYNDGTKTAYYNGQQRYNGQFVASEGTKMDYVATIEQDHAVTTLTFTDTWNDSRIALCFPVTVEDSDGNVVATYENASAFASSSSTGFTINLVENGKLPNASDFRTGVTYRVKYTLDFSGLVGADGEFDGTHVQNNGHWHTEGELPDHDDDHPTDDEPKYPDWEPIEKSVTSVKYTNSHHNVPTEVPLDRNGDIFYTDNYYHDTENENGSGTFYINYEVTMSEPRDLTSIVLTDTTNIPGGSSSAIRNDDTENPNTLTIYDEEGNVATWGQLLGTEDTTEAVFSPITITSGTTDGNLSYSFDVTSYLNSQMNGTVTIPKNYTTKLTFQIALWSNMDDPDVTRINHLWNNTIKATFNGTHDEEDDADATIKTRKKMTKTATAVEEIGDIAAGDSVDGENLGTAGQGQRIKYTIVVGAEGDTFEEEYTVNDTLTNVNVQKFDTATGVAATDGNSSAIDLTASGVFGYSYYNNGGESIPNGFYLKIPAGTSGPVTIVYYVTNATQAEADANNEDSNGSNDIWGVQTQENTVRNPEEKEITTTYEVEYTADHDLTKDFQKWDKESGTATWKVTVVADKTRKFPAGYKIKEEVFKYYTDEEHTQEVGDMVLDLSRVIVVCPDNNGNNVLKLGTDYAIEGNSIVFLKDINAQTLRFSGIRTTIPNYDGETKYYYYNDASIRSDHDSLLDEDDDQNDTDATALIEKKFVSYELVDGNLPTYTWNIIITPPKEGLAGWKLAEAIPDNYTDLAFGIEYTDTNGQKATYYTNVLNGDNDITVRTASGVELQKDEYYTGNGLVNNNWFTFTEKANEITEQIIVTVKTQVVSYQAANVLALDEYTSFNHAVLRSPENEDEVVESRKEFNVTELDIDKSAESTSTLEVDGDTYAAMENVDDTITYEVVINGSGKLRSESALTFEDLLPEGFELVDFEGDDSQETPRVQAEMSFLYNTDSNSPAGVGINGAFNIPYDDGNAYNQHAAEKYLTVSVEPDDATGRQRITIKNLSVYSYSGNGTPITIRYKVRAVSEKQAQLKALTTGAVQYFENTATATVGVRTGTATETVVYQYDEALEKEDITEAGDASVGSITYEIYVNNEPGEDPGTYSPRTLNNGEPLTLTDKIPTSVELITEEVLVYVDSNNDGSWAQIEETTDSTAIAEGRGFSASYNGDTRNLTLKLADAKHFRVVLPCYAMDPTEDSDFNGDITAEEAHNGWYANTATLVGEGRFEASDDEDHIVYTSGGGVSSTPYNGFSIEKIDGNKLKDNKLEGAEFQLYKVAEYNESTWPSSYSIPEMSQWTKLTREGGTGEDIVVTDSDGVAKWDGLDYTTASVLYPADFYDPTNTKPGTATGWNAEESGDMNHVILYAWVETGLSSELTEQGYTIGENAEPHYVILYYVAKTREQIINDKYGDVSYDNLTTDEKAAVDAEVTREKQKALSSYDIAAAYGYYLEKVNGIIINSAKQGYAWPVSNNNKVSKTVTKLWDDDQNAKGLRPAASTVTVQLYQNGTKYGDEVTLKDTTISASNAQYSYTWENLPATDADGVEYVYTVEETWSDENYVATYSEDTLTITNHLVDETTAKARKIWDDENNKERKRPVSIYYQLFQEDESGNVKKYGTELAGTSENSFSVEWKDLPQVDDPDEPTTTYTYFVIETRLITENGDTYWLDDASNKFYKHDPDTEEGSIVGDPLYISSIREEGNIFTVTNTVISSKVGSVKLTKTLTGLVGNHSSLDIGDGTMADAKLYDVILKNEEGYAIRATLDEANSTDELNIYTYEGLQETDDDFTTFQIGETVSVQIDNLPLGAYSYSAIEDTSGDMEIDGYEFDASATGESVTTVSVKPVEAPGDPGEAELINNYIPDKGSIQLTKTVKGLPEGTDLTQYRFPVVITAQDIEPVLYVATDGSLTTTRVIQYIVPGTVLSIDNVPIGKYDVEELTDDSTRMPDVKAGATYDETENPDGVTEEVLARYSITSNGSTTELEGLNVTKNGIRQGTIVNNYVRKTDYEFTKVWMDNTGGELTWPEDLEITVTFNAYTESSGGLGVFEDQTLTFSPENVPDGWTMTSAGDQKGITFKITGLDATDASGRTEYIYYVKEAQVEGYKAPTYRTAEGESLTNSDRAVNGQQIVNTPNSAVSLPMTGGTGTAPYTAAGGLLLASTALAYIFKRKRDCIPALSSDGTSDGSEGGREKRR